MKRLCLLAALAFATAFTTPASAQGMGREKDIKIACFDVGGLARNLDKVVNEQQVYNNERTIFSSSKGCALYFEMRITRSYFIGWYDNGKFLIPVSLAYDQDDQPFWIPNEIFRKSQFKLSDRCLSLVTSEKSQYGMVTLYGRYRMDDMPQDCMRPYRH